MPRGVPKSGHRKKRKVMFTTKGNSLAGKARRKVAGAQSKRYSRKARRNTTLANRGEAFATHIELTNKRDTISSKAYKKGGMPRRAKRMATTAKINAQDPGEYRYLAKKDRAKAAKFRGKSAAYARKAKKK